MPSSKPKDTIRTGTLIVYGKQSCFSLTCDRAAMGRYGNLYLVSVAAEPQKIKALRAALNGRNAMTFRFDGFPLLNRDGYTRSSHLESSHPPRKAEGRYRCYTHRLGYHWVHAMFISRDPCFLPSVTDEGLWRALKTDRFTTPILPTWMPFIQKRLIDIGRLEYLYGHRAHCGVLSATTHHLDAIVTEGFRTGAFLADLYDLEALSRRDGAA
jgi:hypothetical protein